LRANYLLFAHSDARKDFRCREFAQPGTPRQAHVSAANICNHGKHRYADCIVCKGSQPWPPDFAAGNFERPGHSSVWSIWNEIVAWPSMISI
jgi:hypothetical protein